MRITVAVVAAALVALGLWMISVGFMPTQLEAPAGTSQISAPPASTAGPLVLGTALLSGGGLLFILLLRRR
jgi:hypothetical protein